VGTVRNGVASGRTNFHQGHWCGLDWASVCGFGWLWAAAAIPIPGRAPALKSRSRMNSPSRPLRDVEEADQTSTGLRGYAGRVPSTSFSAPVMVIILIVNFQCWRSPWDRESPQQAQSQQSPATPRGQSSPPTSGPGGVCHGRRHGRCATPNQLPALPSRQVERTIPVSGEITDRWDLNSVSPKRLPEEDQDGQHLPGGAGKVVLTTSIALVYQPFAQLGLQWPRLRGR